MTGGGFYVVSFVSCSSCFMLEFSGCYVIKLLGVWRAQAPPLIAGGAVPAGGKHLCGLCQCHLPHWWLSLIPFWLCFSFRSPGTCLCEEAMKVSGWLWSCFGAWALDLSSHLSYSCMKTAKLSCCSGSWVSVGRTPYQGGMRYYGNKMPLKSSPSHLPSQKDLLWLFSSHLYCKIKSSSEFERLVPFTMDKCLQIQSCAFPEKLSKSKSRRVFALLIDEEE